MGRKKDTSWAGRRAVVNLGLSLAELRRRNVEEDAAEEIEEEDTAASPGAGTSMRMRNTCISAPKLFRRGTSRYRHMHVVRLSIKSHVFPTLVSCSCISCMPCCAGCNCFRCCCCWLTASHHTSPIGKRVKTHHASSAHADVCMRVCCRDAAILVSQVSAARSLRTLHCMSRVSHFLFVLRHVDIPSLQTTKHMVQAMHQNQALEV